MKKCLPLTTGLLIVIASVAMSPSYALVHSKHTIKAKEAPTFSIAEGFKQFTTIKKTLSSTSPSSPDLIIYVEQLESLQKQAEKCVAKSEQEIKTLDEFLKSTQPETLLSHQADYQYLKDKKRLYAKRRSECRLLTYQIKEELINYNDLLQMLQTNKMFKRNTPIWNLHKNLSFEDLKKTNLSKLWRQNGLQALSTNQLLIGLVLILFSLIVATYIRKVCQRYLLLKEQVKPLSRVLAATLARWIYPLLGFGIISVFFAATYLEYTSKPIFLHTFALLFLASIFMAISRGIFYPPQQMPSLFSALATHQGKKLHNRFIVLVVWITLGYWVTALFDQQYLPTSLIPPLDILFVSLLAVLLANFLHYFFKLPLFHQKKTYSLTLSLKIGFAILVFSIISLAWVGFNHMATFLARATLLTLISSLAIGSLLYIINQFYHRIETQGLPGFMQRLFGVKRNHRLNELLLVLFAVYIGAACFYTLAMIKIWGGSENLVDQVTTALFKGFHIAGLKVIPVRLVIAFVMFTLTILLGRLIATSIARKWNQNQKDTQVAVASIVTYTTFAIALLIALLIIGIDFTGLAIVAGALSVGIGLGLQSIANNFISGLILLIEKPIKPGDRIVVKDKEGFVKKVRIRSTQITTLAKEDIMIPNADLINNVVTNYMFNDTYWRVVCEVGVAYGSDTALVEKLLFEVASGHPDVVQEKPNEPIVLFRRFGDSSLIFELWCVIYDVNNKFFVVSDLNFTIDQVFRRNNITIAFPQRDVHLFTKKPKKATPKPKKVKTE